MSNSIVFFDTETTGLPLWKEPSENVNQPHLVQLGAVEIDPDEEKIINKIDLIIQPEEWDIPEETQGVHGITHGYAKKHGVSEILAFGLFFDLTRGKRVGAYNANFDKRIIRIAAKRYATEEVTALLKEQDYICPMIMAKGIVRARGKNGQLKNPKLEEAIEHFSGIKPEGMHNAYTDALAAAYVYLSITSPGERKGDFRDIFK